MDCHMCIWSAFTEAGGSTQWAESGRGQTLALTLLPPAFPATAPLPMLSRGRCYVFGLVLLCWRLCPHL